MRQPAKMFRLVLSATTALALMACGAETLAPVTDTTIVTPPVSSVTHPDWSRDAVIYQINTRQYSEAGSFAAVEADLPRIKALGVDILWFMPIHPIGEARRKGSMGSPYAVKDFRAVNPELGTLEDFQSLVDAAHALDMKVIIDWVANHTAWDNHLITDHPDWYSRDANGDLQHPPDTDWEDVADLDYDQPGLRKYMSEALQYWVREVGIDGYRCDVAGMVPTEFWNDVRPELDAIKPVFMLAEWQEPELHEHAFNASYAWRWKEIMQDIVKGKADARDLAGYYADYQSGWPTNAMRMAYTDNHDQNTWDGLPQDIYGDAYAAAMVLQFTGEGIPLIYNGQECANPNSLEFFEKDPIDWQCEDPINGFLEELVELKTDNPALHNGEWGARVTPLTTSKPSEIFSFIRTDPASGNTVWVMANLTGDAHDFTFPDGPPPGPFANAFTGETMELSAESLRLPAWGWAVYTQP